MSDEGLPGEDEAEAIPLLIAVDGEAFSATLSGLKEPQLAYVALTLAGRFCPNGVGAFTPDWVAMSAALQGDFPRKLVSPKVLQRNRQSLLRFFTELPDGRWVPSMHIFATPGSTAGYNA